MQEGFSNKLTNYEVVSISAVAAILALLTFGLVLVPLTALMFSVLGFLVGSYAVHTKGADKTGAAGSAIGL